MNDRFIRKQLYLVSLNYQIDSFNPVYLDKTGELIARSEDKLINWNGNLDGFQFTDKEKLMNGRVTMKNYWYSYTNQGDFDEKAMDKFHSFIIESNSLISDVYQPKYFTRIGLRIQYLLKKTTVETKAKYQHFFDGKFCSLGEYGSFNTSSIGFDIENSQANIRVNVNYAKKQTDNDVNAPSEGLLFDIDFHKFLDKTKLDAIHDTNRKLLIFVDENYRQVLFGIALEMGAVHEE